VTVIATGFATGKIQPAQEPGRSRVRERERDRTPSEAPPFLDNKDLDIPPFLRHRK